MGKADSSISFANTPLISGRIADANHSNQAPVGFYARRLSLRIAPRGLGVVCFLRQRGSTHGAKFDNAAVDAASASAPHGTAPGGRPCHDICVHWTAVAPSQRTTESKYVIYENGTFGLHYAASPHVYTGTYRRDDDRISFDFGGDGSLNAAGTLIGDLLEVRYTEMMQHSDFENAVYLRSH